MQPKQPACPRAADIVVAPTRPLYTITLPYPTASSPPLTWFAPSQSRRVVQSHLQRPRSARARTRVLVAWAWPVRCALGWSLNPQAERP